MKHGKGVVDDERPTKENKREVRGVELTFSRVDVHRCCPLATEEAAALRAFCFGDVFFFFLRPPIFRPVTCTDHSKTLREGQVQQDIEHLTRRFCCWRKSHEIRGQSGVTCIKRLSDHMCG